MYKGLLNHYRELLSLVDVNAESILDVGCGSNDFLKLALRDLDKLKLAVGRRAWPQAYGTCNNWSTTAADLYARRRRAATVS